MAYRHVYISQPAQLQCHQGQLLVRLRHDPDEQAYSIPLEDIGSLMLESPQSTITTATLGLLAKYNVAVYTCDEKHMPNGLLTSFANHSRYPKIIGLQLDVGKPLQKRMWQAVVERKVLNQASVLSRSGHASESSRLALMVYDVTSGDRSNREALAAKLYFPALFGDTFVRRSDHVINAALNYGYAVVRGQVARSVVAHGLMPSVGIHHHNDLNPYNLADDFMEPYRPVVDQLVWSLQNQIAEIDDLTPDIKRALFGILTVRVGISNQEIGVADSTDRMMSSVVRAFEKGDVRELSLPEVNRGKDV